MHWVIVRLYLQPVALECIGDDDTAQECYGKVYRQGDAQHDQGHEQVFALGEVADHQGQLRPGKNQTLILLLGNPVSRQVDAESGGLILRELNQLNRCSMLGATSRPS